MNPKFGRRSWVKLWVNEWLDGTTRFEMTDAQRAFWIDLLAMAGRSRFPGKICAGEVDGVFVGYPVNKFQSLMSEPIDIEKTLKLFEKNGKIKTTITQKEPMKLMMVELLNWDRYQSEYQRQKPYREAKLQRGYEQSYNQSNKTEGEGEVEGDVEVESKTLRAPKSSARVLGTPDFLIFWEAYPRKESRKKALSVWINKTLEGQLGEILAGLDSWKKARDPGYMPYAEGWLRQESWKEIPVVPTGGTNGTRQPSKESERHERSQQALQNVLGHRSGLAERLRQGVSGGTQRGTCPRLPDGSR